MVDTINIWLTVTRRIIYKFIILVLNRSLFKNEGEHLNCVRWYSISLDRTNETFQFYILAYRFFNSFCYALLLSVFCRVDNPETTSISFRQYHKLSFYIWGPYAKLCRSWREVTKYKTIYRLTIYHTEIISKQTSQYS